MQKKNTRQGFTLIELLIVILIISILVAVAVPQYKLAVAKSRLSSLMPLAQSVLQAEEAYYLDHGEYTQNWDAISLNVPGEKNQIHKFVMEFPSGYISLNNPGIRIDSDQIAGVSVFYFYKHASFSFKGKHSCYAKMGDDFANKVCKSLTNKKNPSSNNGPDTDNIYHF